MKVSENSVANKIKILSFNIERILFSRNFPKDCVIQKVESSRFYFPKIDEICSNETKMF